MVNKPDERKDPGGRGDATEVGGRKERATGSVAELRTQTSTPASVGPC